MSYLAPPPTPAPVIVMKDVGGFVADYEAQTELYRASDREVRLHECRSACTLALGLPNVCVYPDSTLKFHLAYDVRNRQTDAEVSRRLFESYPAAVRARLGGLTRDYKILRGSELIALGVRDCGEQRIMTASAASRKAAPTRSEVAADQGSLIAGLMRNMASVFSGFGGQGEPGRDRIAMAPSGRTALPAALPATQSLDPPLPPPRPLEFSALGGAASGPTGNAAAIGNSKEPAPDAFDPSPPRPLRTTVTYRHRGAPVALPKIITGAQPILPAGFTAYAEFGR